MIKSSWLGYNSSLLYENHCHHSFFESTRPIPDLEYTNMKLWPGLKSNSVKQESLYGFNRGLEEIWKYQFPSDCSNKNFIISGGWPYGFGSRIHQEGIGLAVAMQLGRIYLHHPDGDNIFWETDNPYCKEIRKDKTLMCYYENWSSCTFKDALRDVAGDVNKAKTMTLTEFNSIFDKDPNIRNKFIESIASHTAINIVYTYGKGSFNTLRAIPHVLQKVIDCSPMMSSNHHYWWRAISAAFLLRLNKDTLELLKKYRTLDLGVSESSVSIFVRHGDKGLEMQLLPFLAYANITDQLSANGIIPRVSKDLKGTIFLTTDDPDVIKEAENWGALNQWKVVYTNLINRETATARLDWNAQHKKGMKAVHEPLEYISMLLNLEYSVRCNTWICTFASNSCRLIDEIRVTLAGKAGNVYVDLSKESCSNPPCINSGIKNFGE